jgi:hypothetical protein
MWQLHMNDDKSDEVIEEQEYRAWEYERVNFPDTGYGN